MDRVILMEKLRSMKDDIEIIADEMYQDEQYNDIQVESIDNAKKAIRDAIICINQIGWCNLC